MIKTSLEAAENYQNILRMDKLVGRYLMRTLGLSFIFYRASRLMIDPGDSALPRPNQLLDDALSWAGNFAGSPTKAMARISGESLEAEREFVANWIIRVDPNLLSLNSRDKTKFEFLLRRFVLPQETTQDRLVETRRHGSG